MEYDLWVKSFILPLFSKGKDLEIRAQSSFSNKIKVGDIISFNKKFKRRVIAVRQYDDLESMLVSENINRIYPEVDPKEIVELKQVFKSFVINRGIIVFELANLGRPSL